MKKTLVLTHEYYPYHGGIGRYCYDLFKHFNRQDYLVMSDQAGIDRHVNAIYKKLLTSFVRPRWLLGLFQTMYIVKKEKIEMLFTPHVLPLGIIAYWIQRLYGVPYVLSLHGLDINLALEKRNRITLMVLKGARHIVVNSNATKKILEGTVISTPVTVITPYYDAECLTVDERKKAVLEGRYHDKKIILTVGRLIKRKGQDIVIEAMPMILKRVPDVHYCIVGNGPDFKYLEDCIKEHGVQQHVTIFKDVPDQSLGSFYAVASVFAMPTRAIGPDIEGFGITYLEAAHFGLAIIAGKSGGEIEALGSEECALLVNSDNLEEIADTISEILLDDELARFLGDKAKHRLEELPDWVIQSEKLKTILS